MRCFGEKVPKMSENNEEMEYKKTGQKRVKRKVKKEKKGRKE